MKRDEKEYLGIYKQKTGSDSGKCKEKMVQDDLEIENWNCERERERKGVKGLEIEKRKYK